MSNGIQDLRRTRPQGPPRTTTYQLPNGTSIELTLEEALSLTERLSKNRQSFGPAHWAEVAKETPGFIAEQYNPLNIAERVPHKYDPREFFKALRDPGYVRELAEAPVREFLSTPLRSIKGGAFLATPGIDTKLESSLGDIIDRGVLPGLERDPKYADAIGPQIAGVVGQIGSFAAVAGLLGLAGLSAPISIPIIGGTALLSSLLMGAGLGLSNQQDKLLEYERRTGKDVPWLNELASAIPGAAIGLTEVLPLKIGRYGFTKRFAPVQRRVSDLPKPVRQVGEALGSGIAEGAQEATAGILQTQVARFGYDPEAYKNWQEEAEQEFVVGGAAGVFAGIARAMLPGKTVSNGDRDAIDDPLEKQLRSLMMQDGLTQANAEKFTRDIRGELEEQGLSEDVIDAFESIEQGMEKPGPNQVYEFLDNSYADFDMLGREFDRFNRYYNALVASVESSDGLTDEGKQQVVGLIRQEADKRLKGIAEIVQNAKRHNYNNGGLTNSYQYQVGKQDRINDDNNNREEDTQIEEVIAQGHGLADYIYSVLTGSGGLENSFKNEEILGIHGGRGSQDVDVNLEESTEDLLNKEILIPNPVDKTLAASDHGSYSLVQIARVLASSLSFNPKSFRKEIQREGTLDNIENVKEKDSQLEEEFKGVIERSPTVGVTDQELKYNLETINEHEQDIHVRASALEETNKQLHLNFLSEEITNAFNQLDADPALKTKVMRELGFDSASLFEEWIANTKKDVTDSNKVSADALKAVNELLEAPEGGESSLRKTRTGEFYSLNDIPLGQDLTSEQEEQLEQQLRTEEAQLRGNFKNRMFVSNIPAKQAKLIVDLIVGSKQRRDKVFDDLLVDRIDADVSILDENENATPAFLLNLNKESREFVNKVRQRILKDPRDQINEQDIINLLRLKNYFLRGDGSLKDLPKTLRDVANKGGRGVRSVPFVRLLNDLTAAVSWTKASSGQKMSMFMRVAQLPKVRDREEAYLPDMYADESLDQHVDEIVSNVLESEAPTGGQAPTTGIKLSGLEASMKASMGYLFNKSKFGEALARVLESKVVYSDKGGVLRVDRIAGKPESSGDYYVREARPEMIEDILSSKENVARLEKMTEQFNTNRTDRDRDAKEISVKQFINLLAPYLATKSGAQDLDRLGILGKKTRSVLRGQSVSELMLASAQARDIYKQLVIKGAIPPTLSGTSDQFRQALASDMSKGLRIIQGYLQAAVGQLGFGQEVQIGLVDEIGGLWESLDGVLTAGEGMGDASAVMIRSQEGAITQILVNMSKADPRNSLELTALQLIKAVVEPGIFDRIQRGYYADSELQTLYKTVLNTTVPDFINKQASNNNLTWKEASQIRLTKENKGVAPTEQEALTHAVSDFLTEMMVNKQFTQRREKIMSNAMDKIHTKNKKFWSWIANASQAAEIDHIWQIASLTTTGQLAERALSQRSRLSQEGNIIPGLPEAIAELKSYASNSEVKELRKAIALRDSATDEAQRNEEQAKVDTLSDRIVSRRDMVRETLPPPPDEMKKISDDIELTEQARLGGSTGIPVVNSQMELDLDADNRAEILSHTLDILDERVEPYRMPPEYKRFFARQTVFDEETVALADAQKIEGEPLQDVLTFLEEAMDRGNDPGDALQKFQDEMIKQVGSKDRAVMQGLLDRREPIARLEREIAEYYDMTAIPVLSSALWMRRVADNAGNFMQQVLLEGPVSYLGAEGSQGVFEVVPVFNKFLKDKYGMDKIPSLLDIFKIVGGAGKDQTITSLYGLGKQLQWAKKQHDYWQSKTDAKTLYTPAQKRRAQKAIDRYKSDKRNISKITKTIDPHANYKEGDLLPKDKGKVLKKVGDRLSANAYEEKLNRIIADAESKQTPVVKFWEVMNEFTNHSLKVAYDSELITKERYDALREMPYIARYIAAEALKGGDADISRVAGPDILSRQLRTSESPISADLFKNMTANSYAVIRDSMNNIANVRIYRDEEALGRARDVTDTMSYAEAKRRSNSILRVKIMGVDRLIEVDDMAVVKSSMQLGFSTDRLFEALAGGGPEPVLSKRIWNGLTRMSDIGRELVTRSVGFIQRNLQRDGVIGMFAHGFSDGGVNFFMNLLTNVFDTTLLTSGALWDKSKRGRVVRTVGMVGADYGANYMAPQQGETLVTADGEHKGGRTELAAMKRQAREVNQYINEKLVGGTRYNPFNPLQWVPLVWHAMGAISQHIESATRLSIMELQMAKTGDRNLAIRASVANMNYGRSGSSGFVKAYNAVSPFINGMLQGLNVTWRTFVRGDVSDVPTTGHYGYTRTEWNALPFWKRDRAAMLARMMPVGMAFMMLRMLHDEDEDYLRQSPDTRASYILIPIGGSYFKMPIPHELGVPLKIIPEQIYEAIKEEGHGWKDATAQTWRSIKQGVRLPILPYGVAPFYDAWQNHDRLREGPIVSQYEEDLPPHLQRDKYTSPMAQSLARAVDSIPFLRNIPLSSPEKVVYFLGALTGPYGMAMQTIFNAVSRQVHGLSSIGTPEDFDEWQDKPGNSSWMGKLSLGGSRSQFWRWVVGVGNMVEELDKMEDLGLEMSEVEQAKRSREVSPVTFYHDRLQTLAKEIKDLDVIERGIREADEKGDMVDGSWRPKFTPQEIKKRKDYLRRLRIVKFEKFNTVTEDMRVDGIDESLIKRLVDATGGGLFSP